MWYRVESLNFDSQADYCRVGTGTGTGRVGTWTGASKRRMYDGVPTTKNNALPCLALFNARQKDARVSHALTWKESSRKDMRTCKNIIHEESFILLFSNLQTAVKLKKVMQELKESWKNEIMLF